MAKKKLVFRFHNPNTEEETIDQIARIFIDASKAKFEKTLNESIGSEGYQNNTKEAVTM